MTHAQKLVFNFYCAFVSVIALRVLKAACARFPKVALGSLGPSEKRNEGNTPKIEKKQNAFGSKSAIAGPNIQS